METYPYIETYFADLKKVIDDIPREMIAAVYDKLDQCQRNGKTLYVFGNGGSAATATHMVCDMGKNTRGSEKPRMKMVGLNDNMAIFSAYANDEGYNRVFAEQIISLGKKGILYWRSAAAAIPPTCWKGSKAPKRRACSPLV